MYKFLQKWLARCLHSDLVLHNPELNWIQFAEQVRAMETQALYQKFSFGTGTKLYPGARIENFQNTPNSIKTGADCHLRGELLVFAYGGIIQMGDEVFLGEHSRIWSAERVVIGSHVLISHQVNISDTNSHEMNHLERAEGFRQLISKGHSKVKPNIESAPVVIEDHVWISSQVTILKGIRIGKGSIIAASSVLTHDVEPFSLMAGNPARLIRKLQ